MKDEREILTRVIEECNDMLERLDDDEVYYETVDLVCEFKAALDKKDRSIHGTPADIDTYFSKGAQELMGRGEGCAFFVGQRDMIYAMDWEGNESHIFVERGQKIEAQDMGAFTFESFPCLSKGLYALLDDDYGWRINALYGYDYFLCGKDIVLRGSKKVCDDVLEIIQSLGVNVEARPLDKAWVIYEPNVQLLP